MWWCRLRRLGCRRGRLARRKGAANRRQAAPERRDTGLSDSSTVIEPPPDPTGWSDRPIDRFIASQTPARPASPRAHRPKRHALIRRRDLRPDRLAPDTRGGRRFPRHDRHRTPSRGSSTSARLAALRRALGAALDGRRPLRRHRRRQCRLPGSGSCRPIATTSSTRSTPTSRYDRFVREQLAGDILARDEAGDEHARVGDRHRLPGPRRGDTRRRLTSSGT